MDSAGGVEARKAPPPPKSATDRTCGKPSFKHEFAAIQWG